MSVSQALDAYFRAVSTGALQTFRIDPIDRLGIPVVSTSLRMGGEPGSVSHCSSYGVTEEDAHVGALGELVEETFAEHALKQMPRVHGSYAALVRDRGPTAVADPLTLGLPAGSPYRPDMPLVWVEVQRLSTGEKVLVPEEFVAIHPGQLQGRSPLITPITNGQGAGLTRQQALAHGLLELLQRDGNGLQYRAMDQGVVLDLEGAELTSDVKALLERYQRAGVEVMAKLASTDFGLVNVYVVGRDLSADDHPLMVTACGEAADPDRDRALRKALLEYAGSRARKAFAHGPLSEVARIATEEYMERFVPLVDLDAEEPRALHGMAEWARMPAAALRELTACTLMTRRKVRFEDLPRAPAVEDPSLRCDHVVRQLQAAGFDILVADMSPAGRAVHVVKALVPGLEVETMTYSRLGERNVARLLERRDPLVGLGAPPPGAQPVRLTPEAEERLGGPAWFSVRLAEARLGRLYPLYREPDRHAVPALLASRRFGGE
ncbi:YcaO-like family protein [Corallococcus sp. bb12-1]|uniref:YcaO-like family protein n=1 Tax=Corallococcus sp. bb12-1 TaxID=2996784 RepID=UPI00226E314F|nr:YcaO-like family protein [Corallococcus sp. bb12-1]MCY1040840.1 YcaO-like family protein [Corallococcus sp. bb12-1]